MFFCRIAFVGMMKFEYIFHCWFCHFRPRETDEELVAGLLKATKRV